jgi:hypothetical protein
MASASLPLSLATWRWLSADCDPPLDIGLRLRMAWHARWSALNWTLSRQLLGQYCAQRIEDPVLILGPWRSGTTVMHELLSAATGLATTQTWQCMNAASFLITGRPRESASAARPMDGLAVRSDSPQEDEFALLTLGANSAYRAFLAPGRLGELASTLDQQHWLNDERWCRTWMDFLQAVLAVTPAAKQPLLLKSPNHTYRVQAILRRFPRSRALWMTRDPISVFHSNRKMWNAMFRLYALTEPDAGALDRFLTAALVSAGKAADWCCQNLPLEQFVVVPLHELQTSPEATVCATAERLGLTTSDNEDLRRTLTTMRMPALESYPDDMPTAALHAACDLRLVYERALTSHGLR